jgi:phospholipid/cholesterol/gamma-HCH transport system substrate-binding protein
MKGLSMEVKVGFLILVALLIMGGFLFVLGGARMFESGYPVYVDFNNPGGVKTGAPVRIAGVRVGSVESAEYLGGKLDPKTGRRPLVRVTLKIDREVRDTVHDDALFYVTSQGVLGEPFIAIEPGSPDRPILREGSVNPGVDPPRLDLALALGYELLETMVKAVRNNRDELEGLLHDTSGLLKGLNQVVGQNTERVNRIVANVETATEEGNALIKGVRETYVDGAQMKRVMTNLDRALQAAGQETGPLMRDVRGAVADARDVLGPEQREKLKSTIGDAAILADKAKTTLNDAQQIMVHMKRGEGTVGALLMDEEVYDDVQEMLRDLKHNPWKLFWRE